MRNSIGDKVYQKIEFQESSPKVKPYYEFCFDGSLVWKVSVAWRTIRPSIR